MKADYAFICLTGRNCGDDKGSGDFADCRGKGNPRSGISPCIFSTDDSIFMSGGLEI